MNSMEYTHITPVILGEIMSRGLFMSMRAAPTKPQFATGPQKWVVICGWSGEVGVGWGDRGEGERGRRKECDEIGGHIWVWGCAEAQSWE
jgi:hypothetical protein